MNWSLKIASPFGIPIRLHWSMLAFGGLVAVWGGGLAGLVLLALVFGSVVLHELGHALAARRRGLAIADISLYPFGGMARMLGAPRTSAEEIWIAAAGPAVSLALALTFGLLSLVGGFGLAQRLAEVNGLLAAFNLLPLLPMDGGRILRAWLARRHGFYRATRWAVRLARVLAIGLGTAGLFVSPWLTMLAFFLFLMAGAEENAAEMRRFMGDPGFRDAPPEILAPGWMRGDGQPGAQRVELSRGSDGRLVITVRQPREP
jgi:Zn-dependent protease